MAKSSRFRFEYRKNASRLHRVVGETLRNSKVFSSYNIYQEYPVNKVNTRYPSGAHKFDWVIPQLKLVIECHGIQHYECQTFGADAEKAIEAFHDGQARDLAKKNAALAAGYRYVVVSYKEQNLVTTRLLVDKMKAADIELTDHELSHQDDSDEIPKWAHAQQSQKKQLKEQRKKYLKSDAHKERLKRAREAQKARYKRLKNGK